jgi:uncharacterized protein YgiM (DUF1202 family)
MLAGVVALVAVTTAVAAEKYPYVGVVTGEEVYVRSGNDTNYYPVLKAGKGQRVTVQGESFGWLKIAPMAGTFSFVDKAYVERSGDTGTVTTDRLWVRAGSLLSAERSTPQVKLSKGDTVTILGEDEGFYKIQTPATASLWISARYVVSEDQAADLAAAAPGSQPAGAATSQPAVADASARPAGKMPGIITRDASPQPAAGATAAVGKTRVSSGAGRDRQQEYDVLEADMNLELAKPLEQRNWDALKAKYQALAAQKDDDAIAAAAKIRVENLSRMSQQTDVLDAIARADRMFKSEVEIMNRPLPVPTTQEAKERGWDAQGTLKESLVFAGRLYRLVDPATDTAVAYVQKTPQLAEQLEGMVNQYVGVRAAQMNFRPEWNVNLIVPAAVTALEAPAGPTAQPMETEPVTASEAEPVAADEAAPVAATSVAEEK